MIIYIHDTTMKVVGFMNNDLPNSLHYFNDNWHRYLAEATSTFDFTVSKTNPDSALITQQSYVSFQYNAVNYLFSVMNLVETDYTIQVQCDNLNLELVNEELNPYSNTVAHTIDWYIWNAAGLNDNIINIGNNPFTNTMVLTFDSQETKLARLISIINSWGGEFSFTTNLKMNGALNNITLDIYNEGDVGIVRDDVTLTFGKDIVGITRTVDKSQIFNATTVTDSNGVYNWNASAYTVTNSDGNLEFYKNANSPTAYAPISKDMFPSQLKNDTTDMWIRKDFQIAAKSVDDLWNYAYSQLKQYTYPILTYDVITSVNAVTGNLGNENPLSIGDTVTIIDDNFDTGEGGLFLSARVSEQEISFSNPLNNKLTFTNFVKLKSQVSDFLVARMNALIDANTPYKAELTTDNGVQFKNNATPTSTTLGAHIFKGSSTTETIADSYEWFKDGVSIGTTQTLKVNATDVTSTTVYSYQATINGNVVASYQVTITNVADGTSGKFAIDYEPTKVNGTSWKYTGFVQITASDGTFIKPNTDYYYNGTNWVLSNISGNNIPDKTVSSNQMNVTKLSDVAVISGDLKDGSLNNTIDLTQTTGGIVEVYKGTTVSDDNGVTISVDILQGTTKIGSRKIAINPIGGVFVLTFDANGNQINQGALTDIGFINTDSAGNSSVLTAAGLSLDDAIGNTKETTTLTDSTISQTLYPVLGSLSKQAGTLTKDYNTGKARQLMKFVDSSNSFWEQLIHSPHGSVIITDANFVDMGASQSGRFMKAQLMGNGIAFTQSTGLITDANGDVDIDYTKVTGSNYLMMNGTDLVSKTPIKSATDVPWTTLSTTNTSGTSSVRYSIAGNVASVSIKSTVVTGIVAGQWKTIAQLPAGSRAIPSVGQTQSSAVNYSGINFIFAVSDTGAIQVLASGTPTKDQSFNGTLTYLIG